MCYGKMPTTADSPFKFPWTKLNKIMFAVTKFPIYSLRKCNTK